MYGLTKNKPSFVQNPDLVISRQSPFAVNVVPKLVALATSLRPLISAMSSLDSLSPKTHPLESNSVLRAIIQLKLKSLIKSQKEVSMATSLSCRVLAISAFCRPTTKTPLHKQSPSRYRSHKANYSNLVPKLVAMATSLRPSISAMSSLDSLTPKTCP